jgi:hypothetical protein
MKPTKNQLAANGVSAKSQGYNMQYEKLIQKHSSDAIGINGIFTNSGWYIAIDKTHLRQIGGNTQGEKWDRVYNLPDPALLGELEPTGIFCELDNKITTIAEAGRRGGSAGRGKSKIRGDADYYRRMVEAREAKKKLVDMGNK